MNQPRMEPTQTRDPMVPQPTASPESVTEPPEAEPPEAEPSVAEPPEAEPPEAESPASSAEAEPEPSGSESPDAAAPQAEPAESDVRAAQQEAGGPATGGHASAAASTAASGAASAAARHTSAFARGVVALIGRYKLETIAVLLLGVGGAVYPPVWLLGALVALPSKAWDLRDKWTGLVAPVLLVIVSTVLIVVVGGKHPTLASYAFEAWLGAGRVSRIAAVLGAGYLFWRLRRGRREPKQPPWDVPHRLG